MLRDLDAARRSFITGPALTVTQPVVEPSVPSVEGVLLHNPSLGKKAVVLMNWAYRLTGSADQGKLQPNIVELRDLDIVLRGAGNSTELPQPCWTRICPFVGKAPLYD